MLKSIHVFDLDGCVIDSSHRYRSQVVEGVEKIDLDYWRENCTPEKIMSDTLLPMAKHYKKLMVDASAYVVVATARVMQEADFLSLTMLLGGADHIIHRLGVNDNRRGAALKAAGLRKLLNLKAFAKIKDRHFYEDNVDYLVPVCQEFNMLGHFVPSVQGH